MQHAFERGVPFFFADGAPDPERIVVPGIFGERHVLGNDFDNPRFGNCVVEFLAEGKVLLGRVVGMIKDDKRGRLADNQCGFQKTLCAFDGIAGIEGGIIRHVAMFQKPAESPLVQLVEAAWR